MRKLLASLMIALSLVSLAPATVLAATGCDSSSDNSSKGQVLCGFHTAGGSSKASSDFTGVIRTVISIFSYVIGIIAIIMILSAGLKFVTAGGESGKVANAKGTLLWAIVGLVVAALAQVLVYFVLAQSAKAG